jgi:predicted transcriptional regulator of viral defense system
MTPETSAALARIAEQHHGVFSTLHLKLLRIGRHEREHQIGCGHWLELHDGVFRFAGAPRTHRGDLMAGAWAGGHRAVVSHRSAAHVHGLPGGNGQIVELSCPRWRRARHDGLVVHERTALPDRDITFVDGIPVTTVERTIFDLCSLLGPRTIDFAIDSALRRDLTTFDRLAATLRRLGHRGVKGTVLLRSLLAQRDPLQAPTGSEREAMLIQVLRAHGLPEPVRQHVIRDVSGEFVARVDLAYPALRIAIEYDSYAHHVGKQQLVRDNRRRNRIVGLEWAVLVGTAEDVRLGQGRALARDVRRARATALARTGVAATG